MFYTSFTETRNQKTIKSRQLPVKGQIIFQKELFWFYSKSTSEEANQHRVFNSYSNLKLHKKKPKKYEVRNITAKGKGETKVPM